ncbi:MAG: Holliday junction branch migration protein RuvA [Candidatus Paceibacterota bacterium]|jgi:Holliday junction DNA helicase RuvA
MFNYISGIVADKDTRKIVLENQGIGFEIFCSAKGLEALRVGEKAKVYTFLNVSERALALYGFLTSGELESFKVLNDISGIGPKTALGLAAIGSMEDIKFALEHGKIPHDVKGLGPKRVQKILLELTGKIQEISSQKNSGKDSVQDDALEALVTLSFPRPLAKEVLAQLPLEIKETQERVKAALKILGRS